MINIKPLGDRVLIRPLGKEEKTAAGIILPDSAKEAPWEGEILAVGSGKFENGKKIEMQIKKGDKVIFSKYGGDEIKINGEELKIVNEGDILAIIN